ncbi:MAG: 50S ribosomal protein L11 methyltransferase [Chitinophagaceae bacterium]|nr:50S ribosomal protein L11 methyltransferase [Chitinophagaceae bacterium]MBP6477308.1 50S ribosomal protein L11 methyltransferase [Chitinophagaceae bacterium]MBP8115064.1 50S ribosomal protein L11 methyltransferase [Chitinophagaceae bacterium]HQV55491.1 50S ribosomal protein L11 methyltransferase [Chitinophagaceae bacterium]HQX97014.1 50S ribosomal protein L11 methyltransferase [Chitinophagaceae bacterium]
MSEYIQISFQQITSVQSDVLLAQLSSIGFEGFEEEENSLKAFIPLAAFDEALLKEITSGSNLSYSQSTIEETNWNAVWESNFDPVIVDDFVSIRADFHEQIKGVEHEILITPKMSFGTGHHATTYMMIQQMREIDFKDKTVFDFGTGTGVLAILAAKLGANNVFAVDIDDWSMENANENFEKNNCTKIDLQKTDDAGSGKQYDIILANINKNVILENMSNLSEQLLFDGILLLSGLLVEDETDIVKAAGKFQLKLVTKTERNNWIALKFTY